MPPIKVPKRLSTALVTSFAAGVVPRVGLEYIAVGRKREVTAILQDLGNVAEGGAAFRIVVGRFGSGKSFLLQLMRNHAMERGFVVADADLSPDRRLSGTAGQAVGTYRELMRNLATKTRPEGGALAAILEKWISGVQAAVLSETGLNPLDPTLLNKVEAKIFQAVNEMEGLVHGFDFAAVLSTYWRGHRLDQPELKEAALRWLRGEFATRTDARQALGTRVIIDDDTWYDYLKLIANFVSEIGYQGLLILVDEAVNLYKISNSISRQNNYEKLLAIFNDTMQGKASHLGFLLGGTPQFLEDSNRGVFSYEALRSRLAESRFTKPGLQDTSNPVLRLEMLTSEEIFVLLMRLLEIHATHFGYEPQLTNEQIQAFLQVVHDRLGADALLTPREVVRDFLYILNILRQNPGTRFEDLIQAQNFQPTRPGTDPDEATPGPYAEFTI
jgi:BREX system ATP-binding protein BrxC/D